MELNFDFVVDRSIQGRIYPALARWPAEPYTQAWREFDQHWPYTIPLRLQEYCDFHQCAITLCSTDQCTAGSFYPIALGWFDFSIDYFELLPAAALAALQTQRTRLLFYYHEGDNPLRIKHRLDQLVQQHALSSDCYRFVINNSAADGLPGFVFFPDSEIWFWQRNRSVTALPFNANIRSREFTALVRTHKDYRLAAMADLHGHGLLDRSYWSYCETGTVNIEDCPIAVEAAGMQHNIDQFRSVIPHHSDTLSQAQRNDHSHTVPEYFQDSYFHIVLETHFDADQSGGTLISEKTFKPIKHAQPFFVAAPAGTLQCLRDLGYRTFDSVLDNSYDAIADNTQRWLALRRAIASAQQQGLHTLAQACRADCEHNQQLFLASKRSRLSKLIQQLCTK